MSCSWLGFSSLTMFLALVLDRTLGEPARFHPLVGFGAVADRVETALNVPSRQGSKFTRVSGFAAWAVLCVPLPYLVSRLLLGTDPLLELAASVVMVYLCIAPKSLTQHGMAIQTCLLDNDLAGSRENLSRIVSRDCSQLNSGQVTSATIESVLENGSDAVIAPLFWFLILGVPGILLYRLGNTLDAMWGYKTERYNNFGFAAARIDDLLNLIPARCCAFFYAVSGGFIRAIGSWQSQGRSWSSPNAGPVMASGAGALGLIIGGPATYHGSLEARPALGVGVKPQATDIARAIKLVHKATVVFLFVILVWECSLCYVGTVAT